MKSISASIIVLAGTVCWLAMVLVPEKGDTNGTFALGIFGLALVATGLIGYVRSIRNSPPDS